jgi:hypothetical protein
VTAQTRYQLHGYVCSCSVWSQSRSIGTVTFTTIFQQRPHDCWVAIYSEPPHTVVYATDLRDAMVHAWGRVEPGMTQTFTTVDEAVMASMLTLRVPL